MANTGGRQSLGRDLLTFGTASVAAQLVSAATTPIYTRVLGPTEFGVLETAMAGVSLALTVLVLGFDQGVVVRVSTARDAASRGAVIGSSLLLPTGIAAVGSMGVGLIAVGNRSDSVLLSVAIGMPFLIAAHVSQQGLRSLDLVSPFLWSVGLRSLATAAVTCVVILSISPTATGVILSMVAGAAGAAAMNVRTLNRREHLSASRSATRDLLRFGLPLLPSAIAGWSSMLVDRLVLASRVSFEDVGIYSVAARIAGLLLTALYGFQTAWTARAVADFHHCTEEDPQRRSEAMLLLGCGIGISGAAICAFGPELVAVLGGPEYSSAMTVLPILVLANCVFSITTVTQIPALATGKTVWISVSMLLAAATNLGLNLLLVPWLGMTGAATATLAAFSLLSTLQLLISRSIRPADLPVSRVLLIWLALTPLAAVGYLPWSPILTGFKALLLVAAALSLHQFHLFRFEEVKRILLGVDFTVDNRRQE